MVSMSNAKKTILVLVWLVSLYSTSLVHGRRISFGPKRHQQQEEEELQQEQPQDTSEPPGTNKPRKTKRQIRQEEKGDEMETATATTLWNPYQQELFPTAMQLPPPRSLPEQEDSSSGSTTTRTSRGLDRPRRVVKLQPGERRLYTPSPPTCPPGSSKGMMMMMGSSCGGGKAMMGSSTSSDRGK